MPTYILSAVLKDAENTVAFWRLFDLQKRKQSLQETKAALQQAETTADDGSIGTAAGVYKSQKMLSWSWQTSLQVHQTQPHCLLPFARSKHP